MHRLTLAPVRYSWAAVGGPDAGGVGSKGCGRRPRTGLCAAGVQVTISAPDGTPVWWGLAHEAVVVEDGAERGLSLGKMANRIAVAYSIESEDGAVVAQTQWIEDSCSVDLDGRKELLYSLGAATPDRRRRRWRACFRVWPCPPA